MTKMKALCSITFCLGTVMPMMAWAQTDTSDLPLTEWGKPDLQGTFTYRTITPLQRPTELSHLETLTEEQAAEWAAYENQRQNRDLIIDSIGGAQYPPGVISYNEFWYERGNDVIESRRTSLIYDPPNGRMPPRTEAYQKRQEEIEQMELLSLGVEARPLPERCLMIRTVPILPGSYNNNLQIVQTKDYIMILTEMIHTARIIPISDEFSGMPKWEGDSKAHWEGDTLVIDTSNFYYWNNYSGSTKNMKLTERLQRVDQDTLMYDFTIEDPETWTAPWSARLPFHRTTEPIYEYACHEGNHGLHGIMAGWRRYESMGMNGDGTPKD